MQRRHRYYKPRPRRALGAPAALERARAAAALRLNSARRIVSSVFFAAITAWFAYFFLFSDSFTVKTVTITGNRNIPTAELLGIVQNELAGERWGFVPNRNSLFVSTHRIARAIRKQYIVDDVTVRREPPFTLAVGLTEKLSRVVLRLTTPIQITPDEPAGAGEGEAMGDIATSTESQEVSHNNVTEKPSLSEGTVEYAESWYHLDANGIVVSRLDASGDLSGLPVIEVIRDEGPDVNPGDAVLDRETVELIFSIYERLNASSESIAVAYVSYDPETPQELTISTVEGWQVFLSTRIPIETQFSKLELALREKIRDNRGELQYVDLRVRDRVYFK